jgi:hypothetical protein
MWLLVIVEAAEGAPSHFECVNCYEPHLEAQSSRFIRLGEGAALLQLQIDR